MEKLCSFEGPLGLAQFPVAIAWGKHLFPFRTEQLSPTAPMVLGSQGPGRVGRRRFFLHEPPAGRLVCVVGAPSGELPTGRRRGVRRRRSSRATSAAALRCTLTSICGEKRASRGRKRVSRGKRREQSVGTRHPPCGPVAGPGERRI